MKATVITIVLVVLLFTVILSLPRSGRTDNANHSSHPASDLMKEWNEKLSAAELNEELYHKTPEEKKYDLLYNYTHKLLKNIEPEELPSPLKEFFMINLLEMEVNNGGFHQLFTNSSGAYIQDILYSLDEIEAIHTKPLLEQAFGIMISHGETAESLNEELQNLERGQIHTVRETHTNEELYDQLDSLNSKFFDYKDPLEQLILNYIEKNKSKLWRED